MQEIKASYHPYCYRLHLFEPPIEKGGGEAGWDPAPAVLLEHPGPRALLLWGGFEDIKLAESDDDEVKTGYSSSPQMMQIQLKKMMEPNPSQQEQWSRKLTQAVTWELDWKTSSPEDWNTGTGYQIGSGVSILESVWESSRQIYGLLNSV